MCLLIDGYTGPIFARTLKELVDNDKVNALELRRGTSRKKRVRTEVELVSLFSVMCSMPSLERLTLSNFSPEDLDWVPLEELLQIHPSLTSINVDFVEGSTLEVSKSDEGALAAEC